MLPGLTLPASLLELLAVLRPCFTAPGFVTFCGLVAGLAGPGAAPYRGGHAAGRLPAASVATRSRVAA